jgi:hypothetical protein
VSLLPCGGCSYCSRAHHQWERLCEDVDDVLPLAQRSGLSLRQLTLLEDDCDSSDEDLDGDPASPVTSNQ